MSSRKRKSRLDPPVRASTLAEESEQEQESEQEAEFECGKEIKNERLYSCFILKLINFRCAKKSSTNKSSKNKSKGREPTKRIG